VLFRSPYNCQDDPSRHNIDGSRRLGIPSIWADRTGTYFRSQGRYAPNPGTAGLVDAAGKVLGKSRAGVEDIVIGTIPGVSADTIELAPPPAEGGK
jgi:hypothetical protein